MGAEWWLVHFSQDNMDVNMIILQNKIRGECLRGKEKYLDTNAVKEVSKLDVKYDFVLYSFIILFEYEYGEGK